MANVNKQIPSLNTPVTSDSNLISPLWYRYFVDASKSQNGALLSVNNLSDVQDVVQSRVNLNVPSTSGVGATGTWGINISGNSATVTVIPSLTGDVNNVGNAVTVTQSSFQNTGLLTGGTISIGTGGAGVATTFSIASGTGLVVDNTSGSPSVTKVSWSASNNVAVFGLLTTTITFILMDSTGSIVQQNTFPTYAQSRTNIFVGIVSHAGMTTVDSVFTQPFVAYNAGPNFSDLCSAIGLFNASGNVYSANAAGTLAIAKTSGTLFAHQMNYSNDPNTPNITSQGSQAPVSPFFYINQTVAAGVTTATVIDPNNYDLNGVTTAVPNQKFTVQYVLTASNNTTVIQRGQNVYADIAAAKAAIGNENFIFASGILNLNALRCYIVLKQGTTDLTNANTFFIPAGKFGPGTSSTSGLSVTSLQGAYNNSTQPQIITDNTRLAVQIKQGSGADTDNIFQGLNGAGTSTFAITGAGTVTTAVPIPVGSGGTGLSSVGTSGNVLTSNGSVWTSSAAPSSSGVIITVKDTTFTASGTYTPTAKMAFCRVRMVGGGGAGGIPATATAAHSAAGAGGQAGHYSEGTFTAAQIGASQTVTIGAAGVTSAGAAGGNGGQTSIGALMTAPGGKGGGITPSSVAASMSSTATGVTGTGGSINAAGDAGGAALVISTTLALGGTGGSTLFGGGSTGYSDSVAGAIGVGFGAGGGGGIAENGGGAVGGYNGTAGLVIITEYITN